MLLLRRPRIMKEKIHDKKITLPKEQNNIAAKLMRFIGEGLIISGLKAAVEIDHTDDSI